MSRLPRVAASVLLALSPVGCAGSDLGPKETVGTLLGAGTGALIGALPMLVFNQWALGSPFHLAYSNAVDVQGISGHDVLGLNSAGFFGIDVPTPENAIDLLLAGKGMLTLTPILVAAVLGVVLMRRRGHRAEVNVIVARATCP